LDVNYIGRMRANLLHYAEFMDLFGPCVVPVSHWNNYQVRQTACHNPHMLDLLLSASDESFILLILVNYAERWKAEVAVSVPNDLMSVYPPLVLAKHLFIDPTD
jgi:hypothetical protein